MNKNGLRLVVPNGYTHEQLKQDPVTAVVDVAKLIKNSTDVIIAAKAGEAVVQVYKGKRRVNLSLQRPKKMFDFEEGDSTPFQMNKAALSNMEKLA